MICLALRGCVIKHSCSGSGVGFAACDELDAGLRILTMYEPVLQASSAGQLGLT